jgi:hypothetical protein
MNRVTTRALALLFPLALLAASAGEAEACCGEDTQTELVRISEDGALGLLEHRVGNYCMPGHVSAISFEVVNLKTGERFLSQQLKVEEKARAPRAGEGFSAVVSRKKLDGYRERLLAAYSLWLPVEVKALAGSAARWQQEEAAGAWRFEVALEAGRWVTVFRGGDAARLRAFAIPGATGRVLVLDEVTKRAELMSVSARPS